MRPTWPAVIRAALEQQALSIPQAAEFAGVGRVTLQRWLLGQQQLGANALERLCTALELDLTPRKKGARNP